MLERGGEIELERKNEKGRKISILQFTCQMAATMGVVRQKPEARKSILVSPMGTSGPTLGRFLLLF